MSSDAPVRLAPAELIELAGADAVAFAQAQFSSDVSRLPDGNWQWSAWLDAQGRVRNVFALLRPDAQRLLVWLPLGDAGTMSAQLARYVLRSKLAIRVLPDWSLLAASPSAAAAEHLHESGGGWGLDLPGGQPRRALLLPAGDAGTCIADSDGLALARFRLADIAAGLPWLPAQLAGEFVAPALGLARLGATSLDKGCYPGQEIVARLHYRGGNKRHCCRLRIATDSAPMAGETMLADDHAGQHGTILYAAKSGDGQSEALAIVPESMEAAGAWRLGSGARVTALDRVCHGAVVA